MQFKTFRFTLNSLGYVMSHVMKIVDIKQRRIVLSLINL